MFTRVRPNQMPTSGLADDGRFLLWVDGVGAYLVFLGERLSIGGPAGSGPGADVSLLANLSRRHAMFVRSGESYLLEAQGPARVNGRGVEGPTHLAHNYQIELGEGVRVQFRQPSPLSSTATLEFLSDHRPAQSIDGVVLMDETCLLGPGLDNHIHCPDWENSVLVFRRDSEFHCKAAGDLLVNGKFAPPVSRFAPGDVLSVADGRFRLEALNGQGGTSN